MKELSIEEKARMYDEAIEKFDVILNLNTVKKSGTIFADDVRKILPELKESEDERMIQYFKDLAPFDKADELYEKYGFSHKDAIAWLEKQGEHANFLSKIQAGDKVTRNEDGVLVNLSQLNIVAKKQGLQKPTDKVESNFKVGDWVVYCNDDVDLITGIEENGYCINNSGYIPFICASDIRLWTIQDAKDGDVLAWDDSKCIALFKNIYDEDSFNSYGFVGCCTGTFESRQSYHDIEGAHPATKEQCDLLFQKMHEAGYEWDVEKKELIKIEQNPAWSEEDEAMLAEITDLLWEGYKQSGSKFSWDDIRNWVIHKLKSLRPHKQCCNYVPSREYILNVWELGNYWKELTKGVCSTEHGTQLEYIQNHWKEGEYYDKIIVCPQKQWKPSDEQMNTLEYYMHTLVCNEHKEVLFGIYSDLKKLREE